VKLDLDAALGPPDQGVKLATVEYVPQLGGVASGARGPPKKCSFRSSNGSGGVFSNEAVIWPV
jgi:hypothetical protein